MAKRRALTGMFMVAALFTVATREARADILVSLPTVFEGSNAGEWTWEYTVDVDDDQRVITTNFFTIYDFLGFIPGSNQQPADWQFSSVTVGTTPPTQNPADDPAIPNLTWTYMGTNPIMTPGTSNVPLGLFSADSNFNDTIIDPDTGDPTPLRTYDNYSTLGTIDGGTSDGTLKATTGLTQVPGDPVPEPGSMVLLGSGLFGIAAMIRRRRNATDASV